MQGLASEFRTFVEQRIAALLFSSLQSVAETEEGAASDTADLLGIALPTILLNHLPGQTNDKSRSSAARRTPGTSLCLRSRTVLYARFNAGPLP